ncbi:MAG: hypothetical protein LBM60_06380 [Clostridium sp.]|nr:hypothetical protein [Clostridium sp.]
MKSIMKTKKTESALVNSIRVKNRGSMTDFLPMGLAVLAISIVMMSFLSLSRVLAVEEQASQIARQYMLRMETVGFLTPEDQNDLEMELASRGITHVTYEGTTHTKVGYGAPIHLCIQGHISGQALEMDKDMFHAMFAKNLYEFEVNLVSTAKH